MLDDAEDIRVLLMALAQSTGHTVLNGPTVHSFKTADDPDAGLSAFVIIAESHIAIHTWPMQRWFRLEFASCKEFDSEMVKYQLTNYLGVLHYTHELLDSQSGGPPG